MKASRTLSDVLDARRELPVRLARVRTIENHLAYVIPVGSNAGYWAAMGVDCLPDDLVGVQTDSGRKMVVWADVGQRRWTSTQHAATRVSDRTTWETLGPSSGLLALASGAPVLLQNSLLALGNGAHALSSEAPTLSEQSSEAFGYSAHGKTAYGNLGINTDISLASGVKLLVYFVGINSTLGRNGGAPTFNGSAMTQFDTRRTGSPSGESMVEGFYLINPTTGSSKTLATPDTNWQFIQGFWSSYTCTGDVAYDTATGAATSGTNPTVDIATGVNQCLVVAGMYSGANTWNPTGSTGALLESGQPSIWAWSHQYKYKATAGSQTMGWTEASDEDYAICVGSWKKT